MKVTYLIPIFFLSSSIAHASWSRVSFNNETSVFIDTQTIKRRGDLVQVSQLLNFPLGTISPDKKIAYKSSITNEEYDCGKSLSRTLSFRWYSDVMGNGKAVYEDTNKYEFTKLLDGSLASAVKEIVCK